MKPLEDLVAEDLMKSPVVEVHTDTSLEEAAQTMIDHQVSGLLVKDHREAAVGVVSLNDIVSYLAGARRPEQEPGGFYRLGYPRFPEGGEGWEEAWEDIEGEPLRETAVGDIMAPEIISVDRRTPLLDLARVFVDRRIHRVFVSEGDRPVGVISTLDVLSALVGRPLAKTHA
jgi:CBS domain-containing protein